MARTENDEVEQVASVSVPGNGAYNVEFRTPDMV
jgi:hypothetical protein